MLYDRNDLRTVSSSWSPWCTHQATKRRARTPRVMIVAADRQIIHNASMSYEISLFAKIQQYGIQCSFDYIYMANRRKRIQTFRWVGLYQLNFGWDAATLSFLGILYDSDKGNQSLVW